MENTQNVPYSAGTGALVGATTSETAKQNPSDFQKVLSNMHFELDSAHKLIDELINKLLPVLKNETQNADDAVKDLPSYATSVANQLEVARSKAGGLRSRLESLAHLVDL